MIKGIYKSASGMIPRLKKQDIAANNIANVATPGFKKDGVFMQELNSAQRSSRATKSDWESPMIDQIYTDYSQGTFNQTNAPLDAAIEGDGFFILEQPDGAGQIYSRNGSFSVDREGFLTNSEGMRVMGDGGPIAVGSGEVLINESGEVFSAGGAVGNLQIVDFADKSGLTKVGNSGFVAPPDVEPLPAEKVVIKQGFLEMGNINVVREMVDMIVTMRMFETGAKALQSQDESVKTLLNEVGRTRIR